MKTIETKVRRTLRGFTVTELIIVIVVVAILAAVAIPRFTGMTDDAKRSKASAIFESVKAAYAVQSAVRKGVVSVDQIIDGHDPACTTTGTTKQRQCGNAVITFSGASEAAVTAPAGWSCSVSDVTGAACAL